jgi:calcium/calmodulin-dependent protein kinase I
MKKVDHPNIIKLYDVFETKEKIYLQLQMVTGGELFDRIVSKGFYTEKDAKRVVVDVMSALKYLHDMNIVHRDLKPENLLLLDTSDASPVQVADFGLAKVLPSNALLETSCGTLTYVAPEVLNGKQYEGKPTDMWSKAFTFYNLIC